MKDGTVYKEAPNDGVTEDVIREVYNIDVRVVEGSGKPYIVPKD